VSGEISQSWTVLQTILYAIPLFVVWNMVSACFKVREKEGRLGKWFEGSFVYNEPILIHMARVTDADNNKLQLFKIKEAENGGYANLNVEIDGFEKRRIKVQVIHKTIYGFPHPGPTPWDTQGYGPFHCTIFIERDKTLCLATHCETQNWSIVKIYLVSFSIT